VSVDPTHSSSSVGSRADTRLLDLQELDLSIDRLSSRLAALESQEDVRAAVALAGEAERRVGEIQLNVDEVEREQRRLEADIDSMERKIEGERKRLFDGSVANARELQSIEAEVANLTSRRSAKEDRVLELMEQRENLDARLSPALAELEEARQRLAEIERSAGQELVEDRRALVERQAERGALLPGLDPELVDLYEELRRSKRGIGVASLVDGICQGCHQKLSPMYLDRLKHGDGVWRCEYCRRILVPA
jgi:predicted  nucleic acid-binding Zn-ribbon protein